VRVVFGLAIFFCAAVSLRAGNTVVADADADTGAAWRKVCPCTDALLHAADGMHVGYLPGYPASHGCVRTPEKYAIAFLNAVEVGTTVTVFGRTPVNRYYSGQ
jgi:hypothetical protein